MRSDTMKLVTSHVRVREKCLASNDSFRNTAVLCSHCLMRRVSCASKLVRVVAHWRFEAASVMTKTR